LDFLNFTSVFSDDNPTYITIFDTFYVLVQNGLGQFNFYTIDNVVKVIANIFLMAYLLIILVVLVNILIAMFGSTFDNSWNNALANQYFIFAEIVSTYQELYLIPPFNIVQFFYQLAVRKENKKKSDKRSFFCDEVTKGREQVFSKAVKLFKDQNKISNEFWGDDDKIFVWNGKKEEKEEDDDKKD